MGRVDKRILSVLCRVCVQHQLCLLCSARFRWATRVRAQIIAPRRIIPSIFQIIDLIKPPCLVSIAITLFIDFEHFLVEMDSNKMDGGVNLVTLLAGYFVSF